ncbi:MAG: hypothetical protein ABIN01_03530 [Ferruginibacter sp.]
MAKIKSGKQEKKSAKQPGVKAGPRDITNKKQSIDDPSPTEQEPISDADDTDEQLRKQAFEPLESRTTKYNKEPKQSGQITSAAEEEKITDSDGEEDIDDLKDLEADGTEHDEYKKHIYE